MAFKTPHHMQIYPLLFAVSLTPACRTPLKPLPPLPPALGSQVYTIGVTTSTCNNAGTGATVCIQLCGSDKSGLGQCTSRFLLDNVGCNDFEIGSRDSFEVQTDIDFADVTQIALSHDNSGRKPGWLVDGITVNKRDTGVTWSFCLRRWLAKDECDRALSLVFLQPTPPSSPCPSECFDPGECFTFGEQHRPPPNCKASGPMSLYRQ
jgi:hypothetical protein